MNEPVSEIPSEHVYVCSACNAEYVASTPEPGKSNPCPQCARPMTLASETEDDDTPILTEFLTTTVDEIIAEFEARGGAEPTLPEKMQYATMLALVKIAFELERVNERG